MRPARIAATLAIMVSSSISVAASSSVHSKVRDIKARIIRPAIAKMPSLDERRGLTPGEKELVYRKYSPDIAKSIDSVLTQFWAVDLLKALAAAGRTSFQESSYNILDWLTRIDVSDSISNQKIPIALQDRIQLTFLSSSGFARIENSQELVSASGRDLFAGVPVADFCEQKPGSEVPVDYALRFSPWDIATRLASSSRLEASLVNLILKPDAMAIDPDIVDKHESTNDSLHEHGWMDVLDRIKFLIKKGTFKLSDLANLTRRDLSIEQSVRSLILAAAVSSPYLRKDCEKIGGQWAELRWNDNDWLELLACRTPEKKQIGYVLSVEDGDLVEGSVILSTVAHTMRIEAKLDAETEEFSVRYLDPSKAIDSELWFTKEGAVYAARDGLGADSRLVLFNSQSHVSSINQLPESKNLRSLSWYSNGVPKSFELLSDDGQLLARGGFHDSGTPKFWQPYLNGKKDGKLLWWFPGGAVAGEIEFAGGKRFGAGSVYYENGVEGFHAEYAEDLLHGRLIWRDPAQRSLFSLGYTGGKAHGLLEIRHGGRTLAEARFHGGSVEGPVLVRNQKGLVVGEIPYQAGLLDGVILLKDDSGAVRVSSSWNEGQLNGDTEVWYSSRARASYCKFDDGHLLEWASFRPDSSYRYAGKVQSVKEGRSVIDYFGGGSSPNLRCMTNEWSIENCESIVSGKTRPAPRLNDFAKFLASNDKFKFNPEKCGGYSQSLDVSPFTDLMNGNVEIQYRVKGSCKEVGLATSIRCRAGMIGGVWSVNSCESTSTSDQDF